MFYLIPIGMTYIWRGLYWFFSPVQVAPLRKNLD
nr:MAG TPA: hypothetical protein [Caudoviricetes sp.]DAH79616.1 MAG TPA: hypothetical protein [Caudoviricetes sp.]